MKIFHYKTLTCELLEEFEEANRYALHTIEMIEGSTKELAELEASFLLNKVLNKYYNRKNQC